VHANFNACNVKDSRGRTALHCAAGGGHVRACRTLLAAQRPSRFSRAWVFTAEREKDGEGLTALHRAAEQGHAEVCRALCKSQRQGQARLADGQGRTALHHAARKGHLQACRALLEHAQGLLDARDRQARTALHLAAEANHAAVCDVMLECWLTQETSVNELVAFVQIAKRTLGDFERDGGFKGPNAKDSRGCTALHSAAQSGGAAACRVLVHHPSFSALAATNHLGHTAPDVAVGEARRFLAAAVDEVGVLKPSWC